MAKAKQKIPRGVKRSAGRLWSCPQCGHRFANRNQMHSCGAWTVGEHLARAEPAARKLFAAFVKIVRSNGPVRIHAVKTRVAFVTRMTFAAATPVKDRLRCHLILTRREDLPRFRKIEQYSPRCFGHYFDVRDQSELDNELRGLIAQAYRVGMQEHLKDRSR